MRIVGYLLCMRHDDRIISTDGQKCKAFFHSFYTFLLKLDLIPKMEFFFEICSSIFLGQIEHDAQNQRFLPPHITRSTVFTY